MQDIYKEQKPQGGHLKYLKRWTKPWSILHSQPAVLSKKKKVIMHSVLQRLQPWSIAKKFKDQTQVLQEIM